MGKPVKVTGPRLRITVSPIDALKIYGWGFLTGAIVMACWINWG